LPRISRVILCAILSALCAVAAPKPPKLILAIIVDQFRYDYTLRFRNDYNAGLARLLNDGAVFSNAHYLQAMTVTAVGHSTFLSGAPPSISGIIGNEWYDRATGKTVTSVNDPATKIVGGVPGAIGSSPRRLLVSTVPDEWKVRSPGSKVIGISIKDRSAILPAGHMADAAYWYDNDSSRWVTSTYYRNALPEWAIQLNDEKRYQQYIGAQWLPFDGKGAPFCTMVAGAEIRYCGGLEATPWGNEMIEEFAERAIAGEDLGRHSGTDVLAISFSANDYVGHAVGPDDPAVRDIAIRTDRLLGKLFAYVSQRVGADNALVVLTADHGVAPVPEVSEARKMPGGRLSDVRVALAVTNALEERFGEGNWLLPGSANMLYLNLDLVRKCKADLAEVERVAADAARSQEHISRVYTWHDLQNGAVQQDTIGKAMSLGFFGPRSGNVMIVQEPNYLFDSTGTSHGTPYGYDTHVPLIFWGAGVKTGTFTRPVAVNDVAPTLAAILGIETPLGSIGTALRELFD